MQVEQHADADYLIPTAIVDVQVIKRFSTSYDLTPDLKLYATYSEGFRREGGTTLGNCATLAFFQTFSPDIAKNYNVGVKGYADNKEIRYSADVY